MAKRFTDTEIWKKAWFRKLEPRLKEFWRYLCESCNAAGIWEPDYELASVFIGAAVTPTDLLSFEDRVSSLPSGKVFLPTFIEFQYGALSTDCKPHKSVIGLLEKNGIDPNTLTLCEPFGKGLERVQEKEKDKDKEKEKEEGGVGETKMLYTPPSLPVYSVPSEEQEKCEKDFIETCEKLGVPRPAGLSYTEKTAIAQSIKRHGFVETRYALTGMRWEAKSDTFNPADHVSVYRAFKPELMQKFQNLARREMAKEKKKSSAPPPSFSGVGEIVNKFAAGKAS